MIGLVGTLKGMIAAFSGIAMGNATAEASGVAKGISEALVLTFEGVAWRCRRFSSTRFSATACR